MAGFIAGFDVILISLTIDAVKGDVRESLGLDTTQSEIIWTARNFFFSGSFKVELNRMELKELWNPVTKCG